MTGEPETKLIDLIRRPNKEEAIKELLRSGCDVNRLIDGQTALIRAMMSKKAKIVTILLDAGADPTKPNANGLTPLHVAHSASIANRIIESGASIGATELIRGDTPLHYACRDGNEAVVKLLLKNGANVNTRNIHGMSPLISTGHRPGIVRILLDAGADVNTHWGDNRISVLMGAIEGDGGASQIEVVRLLIDRGASVNHKSADGDTVLDWLVRKSGTIETATVLLNSGAEVNAQNAYSETPLTNAVYNGRADLARCFLSHGADPQITITGAHPDKGRAGKSAKQLAKESRSREIQTIFGDPGSA